LQLRTPLVASASPLSQEIDGIRRLEDAGASAIVLYSLFEEQLRQEGFELEHHLAEGTNSFEGAASFFPQPVRRSHTSVTFVTSNSVRAEHNSNSFLER
jgi:dihydroorotate dehydrogenase (fumarate)